MIIVIIILLIIIAFFAWPDIQKWNRIRSAKQNYPILANKISLSLELSFRDNLSPMESALLGNLLFEISSCLTSNNIDLNKQIYIPSTIKAMRVMTISEALVMLYARLKSHDGLNE